jgi:hypothetical protein
MSAAVLNRGDGRVPTDWSEWSDNCGTLWRRVYGTQFGMGGHASWHTERWDGVEWSDAQGGTDRPLQCSKKTTRAERSETRKSSTRLRAIEVSKKRQSTPTRFMQASDLFLFRR